MVDGEASGVSTRNFWMVFTFSVDYYHMASAMRIQLLGGGRKKQLLEDSYFGCHSEFDELER